MFALGPATKVYVATGATDMRKGFDGLYGLVRDELVQDPLSGHLFLFANARRVRFVVHLPHTSNTKKPSPKSAAGGQPIAQNQNPGPMAVARPTYTEFVL